MGGDHKCPLCEATFTRPQHVGRHLRAHTGDRPYACKECPLRFSRSDLLSRHVNKTHRPPDESAPVKESKRGRRKSLGSHVDGQPLLKTQDKVRAASFSLAPGNQPTFRPPPPTTSMPPPHTVSRTTPVYTSQPLPPLFSEAGASSYNPPTYPSAYTTTTAPAFVNPFTRLPAASTVAAGTAIPTPAISVPMVAETSSEQESSSSSMTGGMTRKPSAGSYGGPIGYADMGPKKRACDQCNHSKVRCDFADPCFRCVGKNHACTYNKPHKPRTMVLPAPPTFLRLSQSTSEATPQPATKAASQPISLPMAQATSQPLYTAPSGTLQLNTSVSPDSSFSSPYSSTSPVVTHPAQYPSASALPQEEHERQQSGGSSQSQYRPAPQHSLPFNPYPNTASLPNEQQWRMSLAQQPQFSYSSGAYYPSTAGHISSMYSQVPTTQAGRSVPQPHFTPIEPQRQLSTSTAVFTENSSSPGGLVVTPAQISSSASPPADQRASSGGPPSAGQPHFEAETMMRRESSNGGQAQPIKTSYDLSSAASPINTIDPSLGMFSASYPNMSQATDMSSMWLPSTAPISANPTSLSAPEAPVDRMYQFRTSSLPGQQEDDDTTASQADSSAAMSSYHDMDDMAYQGNFDYRRRASANGGVWATAFNNMTLHDAAGNPIPNPPGPPLAPSNLFMPSQLQLDAAKRPSLSAIESSYTDASGRMPSMSDVKDLWKLFMTDPLTGPTPSKEKSNFLDFSQVQAVTTPRPGMGFRTLSKSNSMPDLKSPPIGGQTFFSTANHGGGKHGQGQDGTTPTVPLRPGAAEVGGGGHHAEALKEWQEKIKHRQASFSMAMQHPGPMGRRALSKGGSTSRPGSITASNGAESNDFPFENSQSPPDVQNYTDYSHLSNSSNGHTEYAGTNRPMVSVFQRNQALNQTLAPERAPSFGIAVQAANQHFEPVGGVTPTAANFPRVMSQYQHNLSQIQHQQPMQPPTYTARQAIPIPSNGQEINAQSAAAVGKMTSALARPGNKRLASQSLVGATEGKKANFLMFDGGDEEEDEDEAEGNGSGAMGYGGMAYGGMGAGGARVGGLNGGLPVIPAE